VSSVLVCEQCACVAHTSLHIEKRSTLMKRDIYIASKINIENIMDDMCLVCEQCASM